MKYKCVCGLKSCKVCGPRIRYHEKKREREIIRAARGSPGSSRITDKSNGIPEVSTITCGENGRKLEDVEIRDFTGLGLDVALGKEGKTILLTIRAPTREHGFLRVPLTRLNSYGNGGQ